MGQHINNLRAAISNSFYAKASPVPTTVETDDGIDFSGQRGRRDDEPVPQIAAESDMGAALDKLMAVVREAAAGRQDTMDETAWAERCILHRQTIQTISMHP